MADGQRPAELLRRCHIQAAALRIQLARIRRQFASVGCESRTHSLKGGFKLQVFATDIDCRAIECARASAASGRGPG